MSLERFKYDVRIKALLYPTERKKILRYCLEEVFPGTKWQLAGDTLTGESDSLARFAEILDDMKIRDTAREHLLRKVGPDGCTFEISKQATCNGKVNFSVVEHPLGSVQVNIYCDDTESLIKELTTKRSYR